MNEQEKILEMIEQGKITAAEGMDLLKTLEEVEKGEEAETRNKPNEIVMVEPKQKDRKYKVLKILVQVEEEDVDINVNIPLNLVKVIGGMAKKFDAFIPTEARERMEDTGVDIGNIDIVKIVDEIEKGTLDNPTIVDLTVNDKEDGLVIIKVYVA